MKRFMFIAPVTLLAAFLILGTAYAHAPGSGFAQPQQNGWYCPYGTYQGGYAMGPGMMGYGMGPGMMGYGMGPGMMGYGRGYGGMMGPGYGNNQQQYQQPQRTITEKDAKGIMENYLNSTRNPNLKLGKIKDEGSAFEAEIVTKNNSSLVDKVLVDKNTGWLRSIY